MEYPLTGTYAISEKDLCRGHTSLTFIKALERQLVEDYIDAEEMLSGSVISYKKGYGVFIRGQKVELG